MIEREYAWVIGERTDDGYVIRGLPKNAKSFNVDENWETLTASYLSINGIGFSAPQFEFSQYERTITVTQRELGLAANLIVSSE